MLLVVLTCDFTTGCVCTTTTRCGHGVAWDAVPEPCVVVMMERPPFNIRVCDGDPLGVQSSDSVSSHWALQDLRVRLARVGPCGNGNLSFFKVSSE